jgi:basic membrane protein A
MRERAVSRVLFPLASALSAALAGGCILIEDGTVDGRGIGASCQTDGDCHAGTCSVGLCTASCSTDTECPAPSRCFAAACAVPLQVAALWEGQVSGGEGWNLTHQDGMLKAAATLPYVSWTYKEGIGPEEPGRVSKTIDAAVAGGAQVVILDSFNQQFEGVETAERYPNVKFLIGAGTSGNNRNAQSFFAYLEQAMYLAGKVAALKAQKRIGIIVDLVTPEEVREANAFALGARSVKPDILVEVGWIGFWSDYTSAPGFDYHGEKLFREELLAARMIDSGCEVIMNLSDNQRAVRYVEKQVSAGKAKNVWTIASNNRNAYRALTQEGPYGEPMHSCLGSWYYNWSGYYTTTLDQIHRRTWTPVPVVMQKMTTDDATPIGFQNNPTTDVDDNVIRKFATTTVERGPERAFEGPYDSTGQRDKDNDGQRDPAQSMAPGEQLSEDEYNRVCWFVKGLVEKTDHTDPASPDRDALVPDGDVPPPADMLGPPGATGDAGKRCHDNL